MLSSEHFVTEEWKLRKVGDEKWIDHVSFPNSIHRILWDKKIIPNPYEGENEKDLKWIEESDWEAEMELKIPQEEKFLTHEIIFESLEPYVRVYLNGNFLFESDNAFKEYKKDITTYLNGIGKANILRLEMDSPVKRGKELQAKNIITLPGDERVYTRKPQYEYGWDWGPRFVKTGVKSWISIVSHHTNYVLIENTHIITKSITGKKAELLFEFEVNSTFKNSNYLSISNESDIYYSKKQLLKIGVNKFQIPITINNPELWWPKGMGSQNSYRFSITISDKKTTDKNCMLISDQVFHYAICDIKLIREKDSIGESFYFSVNGKPTYLKGFNLIPQSHISEFDNIIDNYSNLITQLKEMNCNAIRIWGGGEYLPDQVMQELQDYGIIVWQDFMFAGGMYPGDSSFLKNVEEEITYQVKRLRNYNNIALYCGNNEIDEAWHNWGWQKQYNYSKEDSTKIWNDYLKLFHELIPTIVKKYDPETDYIPSSPEIGWGRKESMTQGDSHYWGVWWGKEPIETFEEKIPRFMSEFGMQAMPDLSTLRRVIPDSLMNFDSPEFKNHQKHPTGFETLNYYLEKYLTVPEDMSNYVYATQLLQAITLEKAIKAQRMSEKCMGTLIWQFNDTWPVTSWSVIDSEGGKKMATKIIENAFCEERISMIENKDGFYFYLLSEFPSGDEGLLDFHLKNGKDENLFDTTIRTKDDSIKKLIYFIPKNKYPENLKNAYLIIDISSADFCSNSQFFHFSELNEINWKKPELDLTISKTKMNYGNFQNKIHLPIYQIEIKTNQSLFHTYFTDQTYFKMYHSNYLNDPLPSMLRKENKFVICLPASDFNSENEVKEYVKKNLKSINHLLGK